MKIVYGIMESHRTRNLTEYSLNNWFKNKKVYVFTDKDNDKDSRFIKVTNRDDYHSNTIKCILGLKYLYEISPQSDFFVFLDNDTYINFNNLEKYLMNKSSYELKSYGNILNHWEFDRSLFYLSGGAGLVITNSSMRKIYDDMEKSDEDFKDTLDVHGPTKHDYSDVTLGYHMLKNNIELIDCDLFHSQPPEYYNCSDDDIKNSISFHYVNTIDKMRKINNKGYKIITTLNGYNDKDSPIDSFGMHNIYKWFVPSIRHCRKMNPNCEIHILTDLNFNNIFDNDPNIYLEDLEDSEDLKFLRKNYVHLSPNPHHMEFNSLIRFVHLKNFCIKNDINEFLYLEPDVLVFSDILEDRDYLKSMNYDITLMLERCAGVCFFNNGIDVLKDICNLMINSYSFPQKEPRAFDREYYENDIKGNYPNVGGVSDMHFWNWYSNNHSTVFKNMDQNMDGIFWHTCITRDFDDSEISLSRWENEMDKDIGRHIKTLDIKDNKCYSIYENNKVRIKYLHFNANTKKIIPKFTI